MTGGRLTSFHGLSATVNTPDYNPSQHAPGIVHFGVGAFHKAHQAVYTDDALASAGGDWRIIGVSLRSPKAAEQLNPQNGFYTVIERGEGQPLARIIGSISEVIAAPGNVRRLLDILSEPDIRIVSLSVTEKAYGIDRTSAGVDMEHSAITADLANPENPCGVLGMLVAALARRKETGVPPFTVLCCDNLPENGAFLRGGVIDFANRLDKPLGRWIATHVAFPSTMVDRITPATTSATLRDAQQLTGCTDLAAVQTEPFSQWVIEDNFPNGRPAWDAGGAIFVGDVAPYENMKLRMLNGAHSMLAYAGFLSGKKYVSDVMQDSDLTKLVGRYILAAAGTLEPLPSVDFADYATSLIQRFSNPNIRHETYQIAMDGTEKLPQRIFQPAISALTLGQSLGPFAFATAAWMRYCLGHFDDGDPYDLRDPRQARIAEGLRNNSSPKGIAAFLFSLDALFPNELLSEIEWKEQVISKLARMIGDGMHAAIKHEVQSAV
ncbi:MAG: mannitol dehydrogenase family protein [Rhodobacteraceae bacterium]|nr:mannitol dehydrogenase family protein [Paracoccaceae bacterium]